MFVGFSDYANEIEDYKKKSVDEIDYLISPSRWCQRLQADQIIQDHINTVNTASDETSKRFHIEANIRYGPTERQAYDIITLDGMKSGNPVFIFIHGGYWSEMSREQYYFCGEQVALHGGVFVAIGYDLAPDVTVTEIIEQISEALISVVKLVVARGCRDIYIGGHSAGAHLALTSVTTCRELPTISQYIKGFILISGIFDARPTYLSSENELLRMTEEECVRISPLADDNHVKRLTDHLKHAHYAIIIAEHETPVFKKQSSQLYQLLKKEDFEHVELIQVEGIDHFILIERLMEPDFIISQKIIKIMGLKRQKYKQNENVNKSKT